MIGQRIIFDGYDLIIAAHYKDDYYFASKDGEIKVPCKLYIVDLSGIE